MRSALLVITVLLAACASFEGRPLVAGQSTAAEVEAVMGRAADKRPGAGGETVYYFPRLPWGYATYAARIASDGKLVALEQRLTRENIEKLKVGVTRGDEVLDLLGPPYEPMKQARTGSVIWTYPMRVHDAPTPKWFLATIGPDGVLREAYLMDDPNYVRGSGRATPP
ncbi:MAG TPA: hypothetical protein VFB93_18515 [Burkholderiales bacterium]|nr:hypothetical protein [Burkholderiales bacterium]